MQNHELATDAALSATKAAPPIAVSVASLTGLSLQDWVFIATLIYTLLLIFGWVWKFFRDLAREDSDDNEPA